MPSNRAEIRNEVLHNLKGPLAFHGFKLSRHTFERITENDLSQQIYLGLDRTWGIRDRHMSLGFFLTIKEWVTVFYPYIAERNWRTAPAWEIRDCNTDIVDRNDSNVWFPLDLGVDTLTDVTLSRIQKIFIPHLDSLRTRGDIISMWRKYGQAMGLPPRHELSIGVLMFLNNWKDEGQSILESLLHENSNNEFYRTTINGLLKG